MELDHLVISAGTLEDGVAFVEALFGVDMAIGGAHDVMGTHNRLLSLGPDVYLEVIAINPDAPDPGQVRWYDLDRFQGLPRLTNWVLRCDDLAKGLAQAPDGTGAPLAVQRGDLRWRSAVPDSGMTPYDGIAPALIAWDGTHPAGRLPDAGCRLRSLEVTHPDAATLAGHFPVIAGPVVFAASTSPGLRATFDTPTGRVTLG